MKLSFALSSLALLIVRAVGQDVTMLPTYMIVFSNINISDTDTCASKELRDLLEAEYLRELVYKTTLTIPTIVKKDVTAYTPAVAAEFPNKTEIASYPLVDIPIVPPELWNPKPEGDPSKPEAEAPASGRMLQSSICAAECAKPATFLVLGVKCECDKGLRRRLRGEQRSLQEMGSMDHILSNPQGNETAIFYYQLIKENKIIVESEECKKKLLDAYYYPVTYSF
jgi:hypothetical protein